MCRWPTQIGVFEPGKVVVASVEAVKGLEFDACVVLGLADIELSDSNFAKNLGVRGALAGDAQPGHLCAKGSGESSAASELIRSRTADCLRAR